MNRGIVYSELNRMVKELAKQEEQLKGVKSKCKSCHKDKKIVNVVCRPCLTRIETILDAKPGS